MEEKIKELMDLVYAYGNAVENNVRGDGSSKMAHAEIRADHAIEDKLRELLSE